MVDVDWCLAWKSLLFVEDAWITDRAKTRFEDSEDLRHSGVPLLDLMRTDKTSLPFSLGCYVDIIIEPRHISENVQITLKDQRKTTWFCMLHTLSSLFVPPAPCNR